MPERDRTDDGDRRPGGKAAPNVFLAAMLASCVVHALLLLIGSVIYTTVGGGGEPAGGPAGVGSAVSVATITQSELGAMERGDTAMSGPAVEDPSRQSGMLASLPGVESSGGQATPGVGDLGGSGSGLGGAGSGEGIGIGDGTGGSGGGGTKFFGVEARGQRFAYIVDVSGSMAGEKLSYLKEQLGSSLTGIPDSGSYYVLAFSSDAMPLHPVNKWMDASLKNRRDAMSLIAKLVAGGGTVPAPAFKIVLSLRPRPDAIYFMTDGEFDPATCDEIAKLNRNRPKVPIHCIALIDDSGADLLKRIARESEGTYTHIKGVNRP